MIREDARRKTLTATEIELKQFQINEIKEETAKMKETNTQSIEAMIEPKKEAKKVGSVKKDPENVTLSVNDENIPYVQAPQLNTKKSNILRGEGYYSSNNSNNQQVVDKPTIHQEKPVEKIVT